MQALLNFDLAIEAAGDGYRARVVASPAGEAEGSFVLPFTDQDLEILILKITGSVSRARRRVRRIESVERRLLEDFGGQLFQAVFTGGIRSCLERSLAAAEDADAGLRIRLRLEPRLENIPWEYLYDREYGFLCLSPETPLVRYVPLARPPRPFPVHPPLRILAMISAPTDVQRLQNEEEWEKLNGSLRELIDRGLVQLDRLTSGSLAALQRPLRRREYHVLHFVGHGMYDEDADDGALVLEDENGQARLVTGRDLGMMLRGHRSLRLVVLNACEGARGAADDPFAGVAQALVRQGIPAVIAMQFEISDPAAVAFSQSFYQALADLLPADIAMVEARRAIFAADNEVEWATPVIYLRSPDGRIFANTEPHSTDQEHPDQEHAERERERHRMAQERAAQERAAQERAAQERIERERVDQERAEHRRMEQARIDQQSAAQERADRESEHRRQAAEWSSAAAAAMEQARWNDAIVALEHLIGAGEDDPAILQTLHSARGLQKRAVLIAEIQRLHAAGEWTAVLDVRSQLAHLGPTDAETDSLIASAQSKVAELDAARRYDAGLRQLDAGDWVAAAETFGAIQDRWPNYRDTAALLDRSQASAAGRPTIASMKDRLFARLVDLCVALIPFMILAPRATDTSSTAFTTEDALRYGGIFLVVGIYEVVLTAAWGGTLGKRLLRLRVVRSGDGERGGWKDSLLRWFIQFLGWVPCLFIGAAVLYASPFWDKTGKQRGWHDRVAGTIVVKLPPR